MHYPSGRALDVGPVDLNPPPVGQRDRKGLARRLPGDRDLHEATAPHTQSSAVSIERRDRDPVQLGVGRPGQLARLEPLDDPSDFLVRLSRCSSSWHLTRKACLPLLFYLGLVLRIRSTIARLRSER